MGRALLKRAGTGAGLCVAAGLVPAVAAAQSLLSGWELNHRAYGSGFLGGVATDLDDFTNRDPDTLVAGQDIELRLVADKLFDNGMQLKVITDLELPESPRHPDDNDHEIIDELYLQLLGAFGTVQFGKNDGILDQKILDAPEVFRKVTVTDTNDRLDPFARTTLNGLNLDTEPDFTDDSLKLTWLPPIELLGLYGLKLGISYTPVVDADGNSFAFNTSPITDEDYGNHYVSVAAGWESRVTSTLGVGLSAGFGTGQSGDADRGPREWFIGTELTYLLGPNKLILGAAYANQRHAPFAARAGEDWNIGLKYEAGLWEAGVTYASGDGLINIARDGEFRDQDVLRFAAKREVTEWLNIGAGLDWLQDDSALIRIQNNGAGSDAVGLFTVFEVEY